MTDIDLSMLSFKSLMGPFLLDFEKKKKKSKPPAACSVMFR